MTNVEVIDENDISRKYKVKIKGEPDKDINVFKPCLINRIILCVLAAVLTVVLFFAIVAFCNCLENNDSFGKNNPQESRKEIVVESSEEKDFVQMTLTNNSLEEVKQERFKNCEIVLFGLYLILVVLVISILIYQLVKNTEEIRFAKLNELHNLRTQVIDDMDKDFQEYEQTENTPKEENKTNIKIDAANNIEKKSEVEITLNGSVLKSAKKKNLREEFLKQYMNAIVEI